VSDLPSGFRRGSFEFTLKAWQLVTHAETSPTYRRLKRALTAEELSGAGGFRDTKAVRLGWEETLACAKILRATKIVFQCPASFRPTDENVANLRGFFGRIAAGPGMRFLWEPRGNWPEATVRGICEELDLTHVVDAVRARTTTTGFAYFRVGAAGQRNAYTDGQLSGLARTAARFDTACVLFNHMPRVPDGRRFQSLLGASP
jgi:uncharacterized protein YecE (DUF72 family)